ncbi:neural cell adhesion molecule 2-like [Haliotis cracherodii]|uniref:neural cell adhesion molecule 2-like n=1 Tax=Haliotis cracherodii TaxID=6455 RepID=UPI0039ED219B
MLFAAFVFTSLQCAMSGTLFRKVGGSLDVDVPLNSLPFLYVVSPNHELLCVIMQVNEKMEIFPGHHKMFRCSNSTEMGKVKMSLTNITREDAGPYGWSLGSMQRTNGTLMTLFVTDSPTLPTIHLLETPVFGHQVTVRCESNSTTIPANHSLVIGYQWFQYNHLLGNNSNIGIFGNSLITHLKSRREHQYECLATEGESESPMATLKFTPEYGPYDLDVNVSGTARLEEDSSLSVSCAADCKPACTYMWLKHERRLHDTESGMMVLQQVRRIQSGYYSCKASNIHGDLAKPVLVDVLYQPNIVKGATFTRTQTINEGQEVDIRCDVDSNPPPSTTWLKDGITVKQRVLDGDVPMISGAQHIFSNIFTKKSAVCRDGGRYRCQAKNGVGTVARETVTLIVKCSVRMAGDHPRSFITPRGATQNVTLDVIAYPKPVVEWKHIVGGKEAVVHKQRFIMTYVAMPNEFEHRVILTHIDVMDSDQGEYSTEMANGVGRSLEYSYIITVQVPPKAPEDLTVAFVGETYATIKWREGFNGHAIQHFEISFKHARATKDQPWTVDPTMINEGTTQVNLRGLDERTEYRIRVRAWNDIGTSGFSNELIIQTYGQGKTAQAESRSETRDREGQTTQRTISDHASSDENAHVKENETSFNGFYPESHGSRITWIVFALIGTSVVFLIVWFLLLKGPLKCMLMRLGVSLNQHGQIRVLENSFELSIQGDCGTDGCNDCAEKAGCSSRLSEHIYDVPDVVGASSNDAPALYLTTLERYTKLEQARQRLTCEF